MKLPLRYKPTGKEFAGGGTAHAQICHDQHLDREVLVKSLNKEIDQKRITDEIAALSSIRSKHVVEIYDVIKDVDGTAKAIVEELITGDDLNSKIPVKDVKALFRYLYAIACGLTDIHAVGRVHRDIKPNNMKFDAEDCLRIYDFGLSRSESDASTIGTIGTVGYLAPELCVDPSDPVQFTSAIDVFAFAATAIKMIRGKIPPGLKEVPPALPCVDADFSKQSIALPEPVSTLLNKCLSSDPKKRPRMSEVKNVLGSYIVQGRHKATIFVGDKIYTLNANNNVVKLSGSDSSVTIEYDGISFIVTQVSGSASISNIKCIPPHRLPGSCVLILGSPDAGVARSFIPVDISFPEVVL